VHLTHESRPRCNLSIAGCTRTNAGHLSLRSAKPLESPRGLVRLAVHHVGYELIAARMLIRAGGGNCNPLDYDELEQWTRVG